MLLGDPGDRDGRSFGKRPTLDGSVIGCSAQGDVSDNLRDTTILEFDRLRSERVERAVCIRHLHERTVNLDK